MAKSDEDKPKETRTRRKKAAVQTNNPGDAGGPLTAVAQVVAESPSAGGDKNRPQKDAKDFWQKVWAWLTRGNRPFTIIVAVSTATNVGVAIYQWRAMVHQNNLMMDIAWLENRPWIKLEKPRLAALIAEKELDISLVIENSGKSPAYIKQSLFHINTFPALGATGLQLELAKERLAEDSQTIDISNTIPPGSKNKVRFSKRHVLSPQKLRHVEDGLLFLTLIGNIEYLDGRGMPHTTLLIFTYDVEQKRFVGTGSHCLMN